eukprot:5230382-Pyramimonas_sp.AAC.1
MEATRALISVVFAAGTQVSVNGASAVHRFADLMVNILGEAPAQRGSACPPLTQAQYHEFKVREQLAGSRSACRNSGPPSPRGR